MLKKVFLKTQQPGQECGQIITPMRSTELMLPKT